MNTEQRIDYLTKNLNVFPKDAQDNIQRIISECRNNTIFDSEIKALENYCHYLERDEGQLLEISPHINYLINGAIFLNDVQQQRIDYLVSKVQDFDHYPVVFDTINTYYNSLYRNINALIDTHIKDVPGELIARHKLNTLTKEDFTFLKTLTNKLPVTIAGNDLIITMNKPLTPKLLALVLSLVNYRE